MRNRLTRRRHADLTALLRAADAPATDHELAGLPRVLGAFRLATATAMTGPAAETRGTRIGAWITSKVAKVTIAVAGIVFAGGVSYAAAGGNLDWLLPPRIESPAVTPSGPLQPLPAGPSSEQVQHQPPATSGKHDPRASSAVATSVPSATEVSTTAPAPSVTHGPTPPTATTGAVIATSDDSADATSAGSLPASGDDAPRSVGPITDAGTSATSEETSSAGAIPTTAGQGPGPSALRGQCTAWRAHQKNGSAPGNSSQTPAAAALIAAAGGEDNIGAFCDGLLGPAATSTASAPSTTTATAITIATSAPGNSGGNGNSGNSGSNSGNGNSGNNGNGNSGNGNNGNSGNSNNGKGNGNG